MTTTIIRYQILDAWEAYGRHRDIAQAEYATLDEAIAAQQQPPVRCARIVVECAGHRGGCGHTLYRRTARGASLTRAGREHQQHGCPRA